MQRLIKNIDRVLGKTAIWYIAATMLLLALLVLPSCQKAQETTSPTQVAASATETAKGLTPVASGLPRLLDLGAGKCIPCKMMAPILDELKEEYAGSLEVVFIDVWQDTTVGAKYGIESIPTQIFYDASGKEVFRHEGFFSKEDILAKWKELGVNLPQKSSPPSLES